MSLLKTISTQNFDTEVLEASSQKPVLVDVWAPWCGPCRAVGPIIEQVAESVSDQAAVGKLNVDENPKLASRYGISSIPTVLIFVDGQVVDSFVGVRSEAEYTRALTKAANRQLT